MIAATLSRSSSLRAFSAKVGLSLAPSSITASILRPITPPAALISSMAIFSASTSDASAIAIVPDSECSRPSLTVSWPKAGSEPSRVVPVTPVAMTEPPAWMNRRRLK